MRCLCVQSTAKTPSSDETLIPLKLDQIGKIATEVLLHSLLPGQKDALKVRPDGTILDGHHRLKVLRSRGIDVDALPREIVVRE